MAWYKRLLNRSRSRPSPTEIEREVSFHLAESADELMAQGMSKHDAMREARHRFGETPPRPERKNGFDVLLWLESVLADLRYAVRSLLRSPGFALVAILSLGLGIGANTAVFSLYNTLVLRTLPVEHPEELVQVTFREDRTSFTNPLWEELRDRQDALSGVFAFGDQSFDLSDGGETRSVPGYWVSGGFFGVLGVMPVAGRLLAERDDYRGCPAVAVVSYGFWQRELEGSVDAVGGTVRLNGKPFEVVGVAEPTFFGADVGNDINVYVPICTHAIVYPGNDRLDNRSNWFLSVLGRLGSGMTPERASARLATQSPGVFGATIPPLWDAEGQNRYRAYQLGARAAPNGVSQWRGPYRPALLVLLGVVGMVLLIACSNVGNLLLARATRRQHEVAIRLAIGSGRRRLVRLLVTESLLLSSIGAVIAVVFGRWASDFLVGMLSTGGDLWLDLSMDIRVLGFTVAVATLSGVLFGLAPAWRAAGVAPQAALRTAGRVVANRAGRFGAGNVLVVGQLALSLTLVVSAGLLVGTLNRLNTLDPGFNREGVLLISIDKRNAEYSPDESRAVNRELLERFRALPGVRSASESNLTPISGSSWNQYVEVDGYAPADRRETLTWFNAVSDDYFATLETPIRAGRDFDSHDALGSKPVAVINETMARRFFSEPQPLGRYFRVPRPGEDAETYEVIGVVRDTKYESIDEETLAIAYFPLSQEEGAWNVLQLQLRAEGPPSALIEPATNLIGEVHPRLSLRFSTLADEVADSLTRPRILAILSGFFGAVALLLAMIGLYGMLAYHVTSRRKELGVRLALGAARSHVFGRVIGEVGRLLLVGLMLGVFVTLASTRLLASFLFGVGVADYRTIAVSAVILAVVAVAAGAVPAWRATLLDPMESLRQE